MNRLSVVKGKAACLKLIIFPFVSMDCSHQFVVVTHRKKVDTETLSVLNILIRVRVLVQIPHHCEEGGLIPVETAPRMEADVWLSVFLPRGDGK